MASPTPEFARYCCELLHAAGPCVARRMFGGYGISTDGLTLALQAALTARQAQAVKKPGVSKPKPSGKPGAVKKGLARGTP